MTRSRSQWHADPATNASVLTVLGAAVVEFTGNATIGLPLWAHAVLALAFVGGCVWFVLRSRSIASDVVEDENDSEDVPTEEPTERPDVWRVVKASLRTSGVVSGEGPIVLIGYAEVSEARGDGKLYHCVLFDVPSGHPYVELRVGKSSGRLRRREATVTLEPGNILWSELTWTPPEGQSSASTTLVANVDTVLSEASKLLEGAERMVVVWKDSIEGSEGRTKSEVNRIVVGLEGFSEVMQALRSQCWRIQSASPAPL